MPIWPLKKQNQTPERPVNTRTWDDISKECEEVLRTPYTPIRQEQPVA